MKKSICIILSVLLLTNVFLIFASAETVVAGGDCGENLTWTLNDAGTLLISGTGEMSSAPWQDNSELILNVILPYGVTTISDHAFYNCKNMKSVSIPDSVISIGSCAFTDCAGLTELRIPYSVETIGYNAFTGCTGLSTIEVDAENPYYKLEGNCFIHPESGTLIRGFDDSVIPSYVTYIAEGAFMGASNLETVIIPDGVDAIDQCAFYDCTSLKEISIPASVTRIATRAFSGCSALTKIEVDEDNPNYHSSGNCLINTDRKRVIAGCQTSVIPADGSVVCIDEEAFRGATGLSEIEIPEGITSICKLAFSGCTGLTKLHLPASFLYFDDEGFGAFDGCSGLTEITVSEENQKYYAVNNCLIQGDVLALGCKTSQIPDDGSVKDIGGYAFFGNTELISMNIPDCIETIGEGAFANCTSLESVAIPENTVFFLNTFSGCSGMTSISLPADLTYVDYYVFFGCDNLRDVYFAGTEEDWNEIVIEEGNDPLLNATIHYGTEGPENPNGGGYQVGDIITFGGYPQSQVTDAETITALDAVEKNWKSYGYYSVANEASQGQMEPGDWMRYADIMLDGIKYRAVTFDCYRPQNTAYVVTEEASYEQYSYQDENGYTPNNTYYFRYESLHWRILDPAEGLVLCENIIDAQAFHNTVCYLDYQNWQDATKSAYPNNYEKSSLRQWLIDDFYNTAFSAYEQTLIGETSIDNSAYSDSNPFYGCANTTDKVFLLSYSDALNTAYGFSSEETINDSARRGHPTEYAKCQGVYVTDSYDSSSWFLRSAGPTSTFVTGVDYFGSSSWNFVSYITVWGVRPAFQFKNEIIETNNSNGGGQNSGYQTGDIITFGSYPQSQVTDEETLEQLDAAEKNWQSYGYYSGTGEQHDGQMQPGDWMRYADIILDGAKYRAVTFDTYRPIHTDYQTSSSPGCTCQYSNGYLCGNIYYFRYEPLQWRVLDPEKGLVLCESIIDSQPFNNTSYVAPTGVYVEYWTDDNGIEHEFSFSYPQCWQDETTSVYLSNYEKSSLRQWLINDFYITAFNEEEQNLIKETHLDNSPYQTEDPLADLYMNCADTDDKIFLLSWHETLTPAFGYSSSDNSIDYNALYAYGTDYAKCQGLALSDMDEPDLRSDWWLRCPGSSLPFMIYDSEYGWKYVGDDSFDATDNCIGVRPAFCFKNGIPGTGDPTGGCITHTPGEPVETVLTPATCGEAGEKKITVKCTVCGETISETTAEIPATGHDWGAWTDAGNGTHKRVCGNDPAHVETAAHVWDDGEVTKAATCKEQGETLYACTVCGAEKTEPIVLNPANHANYGTKVENAAAATCTEAGYTGDTYCLGCGVLLNPGAVINATGHDWDAWVNAGGGKHTRVCKHDAGHTETAAHTPGEPVETVVKAPTCTTEGSKKTTVSCTACGVILSEEYTGMEKTPHTDANNDGVCDDCNLTIDKDLASHSGRCVCGQYHTGPFAWVLNFFHRITYFFKNLFSK